MMEVRPFNLEMELYLNLPLVSVMEVSEQLQVFRLRISARGR